MCKLLKPTQQIQALRQTLSQYPTGVAIVTALADSGQPVGMTINSFSSASLTPPLITWCVDRKAHSYHHFSRCKSFTITVLAENQQHLAQKFSRKGEDKFRNISCENSDIPPVIPNGSAELYCEHQRTILLGDHLMLVGQVTKFVQNNQPPLVFAQGSFQQLSQPESAITQEVA